MYDDRQKQIRLGQAANLAMKSILKANPQFIAINDERYRQEQFMRWTKWFYEQLNQHEFELLQERPKPDFGTTTITDDKQKMLINTQEELKIIQPK